MKHANLLTMLLPPVAYDPNGEQLAAELQAEGNALDAAQASAAQLISAAPFLFGDPSLIPDWERVLAITPPPSATMTQRQQTVQVRLLATGGLTLDYFKGLLQASGYTVLMDEPRGFFAGQNAPGDRIYDPTAVLFYWRIRIRQAGQLVGADLKATLEAWLNDIKPAFSHFDIED